MKVHLSIIFFSMHFSMSPVKNSFYLMESTDPTSVFENITSFFVVAEIRDTFLPQTLGTIIDEGAPRLYLAIVLLRCRLNPLSSINTFILSPCESFSKNSGA